MTDTNVIFDEIVDNSNIWLSTLIIILIILVVIPFFLTLNCSLPIKSDNIPSSFKLGNIVAIGPQTELLQTLDGKLKYQKLEEHTCGIILNDEKIIINGEANYFYKSRFFSKEGVYLGVINGGDIIYSRDATKLQLFIYTVIYKITKYTTIIALILAIIAIVYQITLKEIFKRERKGYLEHYINKEKLVANQKIIKLWNNIIVLKNNNNHSEWIEMIIKADTLVYDAFLSRGYSGEAFADILKQLNVTNFPPINRLWEAHKLRNRIAHEVDIKIDYETVSSAMNAFETSLKELQILEKKTE